MRSGGRAGQGAVADYSAECPGIRYQVSGYRIQEPVKPPPTICTSHVALREAKMYHTPDHLIDLRTGFAQTWRRKVLSYKCISHS